MARGNVVVTLLAPRLTATVELAIASLMEQIDKSLSWHFNRS